MERSPKHASNLCSTLMMKMNFKEDSPQDPELPEFGTCSLHLSMLRNNCDDSSSTFSSANESEIIKQVDDKFEERLDPEETGDSASMLPYCFESTLKEDMYPNKHELSSSNSVIKQNLLFKECEQQIGEMTFLPGPSLKPNGKRKRLNYICDGCGKYIRTKKKLIKHMRKFCTMPNSEKRPFKCEECGKYLLRRKSFKEHMFTHRGYKPFKCTECDKSVLGENPNESKVQGENNQFIFTPQPSLKRNRKENGGEEGTQIDEEVTGVMRNGRPSIYSGSPF
uniref:C2H2-type domain-containing protein n=1 Tax=Timema tahoe TaxID=61484 RepID=A0A7R9P130_9NEOP|nr:unnamed protein product [Timema tahoe]